MRTFGTQGPVGPNRNYIVNRSEKIEDFLHRVKEVRYIVIFAPRQTGKTTFFQRALDILSREEKNDFPIQLNFEVYGDCTASVFYNGLYEDILEAIENTFQQRGQSPPEILTQFLRNAEITDHLSMQRFFRRFGNLLNAEFGEQRVILIIDEFDGIPYISRLPDTFGWNGSLITSVISLLVPGSGYSKYPIRLKNSSGSTCFLLIWINLLRV